MMEDDHGKMKSATCIFLPSFAGGGAERVAVLLANYLVEHGRDVQVVVQKDEGPWRAMLHPRAQVIALGTRYRWLIFKLARYLRTRNPGAVISFMNWYNVAALIAAAMSRWRGRLIVNERVSLQSMKAHWGLWQTRVIWVLMHLLYRKADCVVAVSHQLAKDMISQMNLPEGKVVAIPNPVPVNEIRRAAMEQVTHRFFSDGVPVVMGVGRLYFQKDFPTLIRALALLRRRRDVRLMVLGEGPDRSELEALVGSLGLSEAVDFRGFVSPPWPWMARAAVFVLSSRAEGWPNVLAEALALGVPVVATDCPTGPREILDDGRFGPLIPVGDVEAMAAAIEATLDAPPDKAALRHRAEEWSTERALEAYISCIEGRETP